MNKLQITGGNALKGTICISGAKNAVLSLMVSGLLTEDKLVLQNVPRLQDVATLQRILEHHGADCQINNNANKGEQTLSISAKQITSSVSPYCFISKMRAGFWIIAPLLARHGEACVSLPGGCAIGTRPVDFIISSLKLLGAEVNVTRGYVIARTKKRLKGNRIVLPKKSVGTTHTVMMAATLAEGDTLLENAACEPEVLDLANCLKAMGAKIEGEGTSRIHISGVEKLFGTTHRVMPDRIEIGTYALAVAMTGGEVILKEASRTLLPTVLEVLQQSGVQIEAYENGLRVKRDDNSLTPFKVVTGPFPEFPTDLQAQCMAMMTQLSGVSSITETIFENRFMHVGELCRLGAKIELNGQTATVIGGTQLTGAQVMATDLRASVSLVLAALVARGVTIISRVYHLDRGFEKLEDKLTSCGAMIKRIT